MSTQFYYKNKNYIRSKRNYTDDYSNVRSLKINMIMSGKYLATYPCFKLNTPGLSGYPEHKEIKLLKLSINNKLKTKKPIIIGPGANGILQNLVKILFSEEGNLVTPYLTFNQVEYAVSSLNCYTKRVFMKDCEIDFFKIYKAIDANTKMVYICNPNNPTGITVSNDEIINLANKTKTVIVVDESLIEFSNTNSLVESNFPDNILIVRTFSKAYGLANLRVGYLICNKEIEQLYQHNVTVNEVSGLSCVVAEKVFNSIDYVKNISLINQEKEYLTKKLSKVGIECYDSHGNIILTKNVFDRNFLKQLAKNQISVLPVYTQDKKLKIRIAVQEHKINKLFIKGFYACLDYDYKQ